MSNPKYMIRPSDYEVFSLNSDGMTYSGMAHKEKYPDNLHHEYPLATLLNCGFFEGVEEELPFYAKMKEAYWRDERARIDGLIYDDGIGMDDD